MEQSEYFTFRNKAMLKWLGIVFLLATIISLFFPPAFWLCTLGTILLFVGMLTHSGRTGQWYTWQNWEPELSWFEGWSAITGCILIINPLAVAIIKARFF